jgi:membrane-associated phospholipid phosphatase
MTGLHHQRQGALPLTEAGPLEHVEIKSPNPAGWPLATVSPLVPENGHVVTDLGDGPDVPDRRLSAQLQRPGPRATWADVGVHRVAGMLLGLEICGLIVQLILFRVTGLQVVWSSALPLVFALGGILLFWAYFAWEPGSPREWIIPQAALVLALLLASVLIGPPTQYAAIALGRPPIDPWLAAADQYLGLSVSAAVRWTELHPQLLSVLRWAYNSLLPQLFMPVFLLPFFNDREALWEYAWHFLVCSVITVSCLALWPAACVFSYEHFTPLADVQRFVTHFEGVRAGTLTVIDYKQLEGLVSCPSFHVAGAWMVTWAFRRSWLWMPLAVVNVVMSLSTVMLGLHYGVDLLATAVMVAISIGLYRLLALPFLRRSGLAKPNTTKPDGRVGRGLGPCVQCT